MKTKKIVLLMIFFMLQLVTAYSQIDSVIVEKYYVSDAKDATDITGGGLPAGSVTYRIYIDLAAGSKLLKIYGDAAHAFIIESTDDFFNNIDRGKSFGKEITSNRLNSNTLALDTWLTIGQASNSFFGVLKTEDINGSVIGGINNDGGSAGIQGGLLVNTDPSAGIALTAADGLVPANTLPTNWISQLNGATMSSSIDTTIFGSLEKGRKFITNNFYLSNSGTTGTTVNNRVLIAQLTTKGELSFAINAVIEETDGTTTRIVKYVAENISGDEKTSRFLKYPAPPPPPPLCGCNDPEYLEFRKNLECFVQDSCKTKIVYGCTDPNACNYNPLANFNIQSVCCYPGRCNDRDIRVVCPDIQGQSLGFDIYPNPANEMVTIKMTNGNIKNAKCSIYDSNGTPILTEDIEEADHLTYQVNVSCLSKGYYIIRLTTDGQSASKTFIKN
jgi:hypothetical protein